MLEKEHLLNIEMDDNLKKFVGAWEETLMSLEKKPEADVLKDLHHRQLEKSTLVLNALALDHSDPIHREEPKSCSRLRAVVPDVLEHQQQNSLTVQ